MRSEFQYPLRRGFFFWAAGSYICAASTSTPAAVIHSRVTSMIPSSSPTRSFLGNRQAALHKLNQDVGRGGKDGLRAAIGVGSDELERPVTDAEDALPAMPVQHSRCQLLANACMAASRVGS